MLIRQNKYYNNLTNINNIGDEENNETDENEDNDYGHFCELDIEEPIQKNITNYNKYYVYNYNYNDQKKDDDIDELKELKEINEKYNNIYFIIHLTGITATGIILLYFTLE